MATTSSHSSLDVDQFGILLHQRALAEIVELIHCAYLVHLKIMDVAHLGQSDVSLCEEMPVWKQDGNTEWGLSPCKSQQRAGKIAQC